LYQSNQRKKKTTTTTVFIFFLFKNILPADGVLKCPICHESRRLASVQEIGQLTKNHTLASLKQAEQHRLAQLGICELCNKRSAYGRCYHCRALACFRCMDDHERILATEQAKDYAELVKIRNTLTERISQWDKKLTDSKETIQQTIHNDAEKQIKEIQGKKQKIKVSMIYDFFLCRERKVVDKSIGRSSSKLFNREKFSITSD